MSNLISVFSISEGDRDKAACCDGSTDPDEHGILGDIPELLEFQMLPDPFEEPFIMPAVLQRSATCNDLIDMVLVRNIQSLSCYSLRNLTSCSFFGYLPNDSSPVSWISAFVSTFLGTQQ